MERRNHIIRRIPVLLLAGTAVVSCASEKSFVQNIEEGTIFSPSAEVIPKNEIVEPSEVEIPVQVSPTSIPVVAFIEPTIEANEVIKVSEIPYVPNQTIAVIEHHNPSYGVHDGEQSDIYMTKEVYEAQLKFLKDNGFYTPSESELLGWLEGKHGLPDKSVIIRIDIGLPEKDYEDGFRLIEKYGFKAVLFILTTHISDESTEDSVGWDKIKEYVDRETLIPGAHGTNHPDYVEISESEARWDALNAKRIIEEKLGRKIYFFAYPYDSEAHENMLLGFYKMLFGRYQNRAIAGNPLVGTHYPYIKGGIFDWVKFEHDLMEGIGENDK